MVDLGEGAFLMVALVLTVVISKKPKLNLKLHISPVFYKRYIMRTGDITPWYTKSSLLLFLI